VNPPLNYALEILVLTYLLTHLLFWVLILCKL